MNPDMKPCSFKVSGDREIEKIDREIEDREMEENGTMGQRKY